VIGMEIKYLWVSEYKNLKDIKLKFKSGITLMVGQNGLGKSNLIEILTIIFRNLDSAKNEVEFKEQSRSNPFSYSLYYKYKNKDILIHKYENTFYVITNNIKGLLTFDKFVESKKDLLPQRIIGYYSGENKRIYKLVEEIEEQVKKEIRYYHQSDSKSDNNQRHLIFTQNYHSQIILLILALYKNKTEYQDQINKLFLEYLDIEDIISFDIKFNNPPSDYYKRINKDSSNFLENFNNDVEHPFWNLKGNINKLISLLFNNHLDDFLIYENVKQEEDKRSFVKEILEFRDTELSLVRDELLATFSHPFDLFNAFEASSILDVLGILAIKVKCKDIDEFIYFEQLSEGQQQLITIMGLILISSNEETLFLFDEPDTHINPNWQRNYLKLIRKINYKNHRNHIFIATHSPFLVQAYENNVDLLLFKKSDNNIVIDTENYSFKNWRIDQVLMSEYFDLPSSRPENIDEFMNLRKQLLEKKTLSQKDRAKLEELKNELGYLPTGETIIEIESMIQLNKVAKLLDE